MSSLGNLVVSLTAETAQFRSGMEKAAYQAQKSFNSISRDAKTLVGGLAAYFSAQMFTSWIKGAIDAADALNDLSERTGIATDSLSKLQYAAKLSDVSTEEFATNIAKFNRSIAETARGTGEAQKAFAAIGVSVKDANGNIKATDELLAEVADKFAQYEDGANKSALAMALFGRSGVSMITFLNNGREGLARMGGELERLGGVIMPDAARRAGEFNDNLDRLKTATNSAAIEIGSSLIPYLTELANQFLLARKNGLTFGDMLKLGLTNPFGNIQDEIRSIDESYRQLIARGEKDGLAAKSLERRGAYLRELAQVEALAAATGDMSDQISRRMASEGRGKSVKTKQEAPALAEESKKVTINDEAAKLIERQAQAVQKLTMSDEELAVAEVFLAGATMQQLEASQRLADVLTRRREEQSAAMTQLEEALALNREWKTLYDETASPAQKLADEEARLLELRERLLAAGYGVAEVEQRIAEARMNAFDKLFPTSAPDQLKQLEDIAKRFGDVIGTAFEDAVISGGNLRSILKGVEQDLIRIVMRNLVTKPLQDALGSILGGASGGASSGVGAFFQTLFGARAMGGDVFPDKTYLVGERGPELFVTPRSGGTIVPSNQIAGQLGNQVTVNNVFTINGAADRRSQMQIAAATGQAIQRAIGRNT
jgi:hypothetical protein